MYHELVLGQPWFESSSSEQIDYLGEFTVALRKFRDLRCWQRVNCRKNWLG